MKVARLLKMSVKQCNVKLNNGNLMPVVGLGTYKIRGTNLVYDVLDAGLRFGYRAFDTAAVYGNEEDCAKALSILLPKYALEREDIFLTSKLGLVLKVVSAGPADHLPERVRAAVATSLKKLNTSYLDLYLVHWPGVAARPVDSPDNAHIRTATWLELVQLHREGVLRSIGVSNYTTNHLQEILKAGSGVAPAVNQVEFHPYYQQRELLKFCKEHNILLQAYCSLGGGSSGGALLHDASVMSIASQLQRSPAQVLLRWALNHDVGIIPKSVNLDRIAENINLDFLIPDKFMEILNNISVVKKFSWDPEIVL